MAFGSHQEEADPKVKNLHHGVVLPLNRCEARLTEIASRIDLLQPHHGFGSGQRRADTTQGQAGVG